MKLYATTTSERASKGQGGKWLDIEIRNEQKRLLAMITIRSKEPQSAVIGIVNAPDVKIDTMIEKGKSQKGEKEEIISYLYSHIEWEHIRLDSIEDYSTAKLEKLSLGQLQRLGKLYNFYD